MVEWHHALTGRQEVMQDSYNGYPYRDTSDIRVVKAPFPRRKGTLGSRSRAIAIVVGSLMGWRCICRQIVALYECDIRILQQRPIRQGPYRCLPRHKGVWKSRLAVSEKLSWNFASCVYVDVESWMHVQGSLYESCRETAERQGNL